MEGVTETPSVNEVIEKDPVLEKFRIGDLLVHVVEPPGFQRGENGLELDLATWEAKLQLLSSEEGMVNTSSTLIMEGKPIDLYVRPIGFIFDAKKVTVENVAASDSGSGHNQTNFHSLGELKDYYKARTGSEDMNEVVITTKKEAIVGLIKRKGPSSPSALAGLEAVRNYLRNQGLDLPVYEYDERKGTMAKYSNPDSTKLLENIRPENRGAYEKALRS